jgi:hypothetical protein
MSDFLRIPFALRASDGEMVDVNDVPNGLACDCICPSCKTPLVARQGNDREWHFAHAPKGVYDKTSNECKYSVYVSIGLMAKRLFLTCKTVSLPDFFIRLPKRDKVTNRLEFADSQVTGASVVNIESCQVETDLDGLGVDILVYVKGVPLVFYLIHPERALPVHEDDFKGRKIGVVSIDLGAFLNVLHTSSGVAGGYLSCLAKSLFEDSVGKKWVFHPKIEKMQSDWDKAQAVAPSQGNKPRVKAGFDLKISEYDKIETKHYQARFRCLNCKHQWKGANFDRTCPSCKEHIYTTELGKA